MSKRVKYVGQYDEVEVPDARAVVKRNDEVKVSMELATSLLEQSDNWVAVKATKKEAAK